MDAKLVVAKYDQTLFEGDSGGYYVWSNSKVPLLSDLKLGTGRLVLRPRGFTLPHYADCSKIGFVLEGTLIYILIHMNNVIVTVYLLLPTSTRKYTILENFFVTNQ